MTPSTVIMAFNPYHFKSKQDAMSRAKKAHVCKACLHSQPENYGKLCPSCGVKGMRVCFPSKAEHNHGALLIQQFRRGEIENLVFHPRYPLIVNGVEVTVYTADGEYIRDGVEMVFDVKPRGLFMDKLAEIKIALFEALTGKQVTIVRK